MLGENFSAPFVIIWKRRKIGRESKFFFSKLVKNLSISNDDTKNLKVFFKFTKNIRRFEAKRNASIKILFIIIEDKISLSL